MLIALYAYLIAAAIFTVPLFALHAFGSYEDLRPWSPIRSLTVAAWYGAWWPYTLVGVVQVLTGR